MNKFLNVKTILFLILTALLLYIYWVPLVYMESWWNAKEEYSHGYLIPFVTLYFIWQKKADILKVDFNGSWLGLLLLIFGLFIGFAGIASSVYTVQQYGFLISLYGLIYAFVGWKAFRIMLVPLLILIFMIPLPNFIYFNLSQKLQLISSAIGVAVIRLFDISVYLEGNVIDLGVYKLQVVEACSGLRYLFPLMSFGFICAYLFSAPFWQRALIFLTTIPITVLMNSFRIGMIGVLVDNFGIEQAEGFLHDFEGWIIFMACVGILFLEMWLLTILFNRGRKLSQVFGLEVPEPIAGATPGEHKLSAPFLATIPLLVVALVAFKSLENKVEIIPERQEFISFPDQIKDWEGTRSSMDPQFISALTGMTDYIISDYKHELGNVNFYVAYYDTQKAGSSIHSPRSCLPGGGWVIKDLQTVALNDVDFRGKPLEVNRALIQMGESRQLVYYWFQQRGRNITNEYLAKWYLFWDSLTRNRTDGALVRVIARVNENEEVAAAEKRLSGFMRESNKLLQSYIPD